MEAAHHAALEERDFARLLRDLHRQLVTSRDRFELRTVITGSQIQWLKAGVRDQLDCDDSDTADLSVAGRGAELVVESGGNGTLVPAPASTHRFWSMPSAMRARSA